ncbi:MAG: hypothetical protein HQK92_00775, partial [Nitrospirae bacterium]|nr:hypothetical protein [Nitrospirota bacterium]
MQQDKISGTKYLLTVGELSNFTGDSENAVKDFFQPQELIERGGRKSGIHPAAVKRYLSQRGVDYSFKVVSHINLRGGIGKTTATVTCATRAL